MKSNQTRLSDEMPSRNLHLVYQLDANRINAKQESANVNQLELWHRNKVIFLEMCRTAYDEARSGSGPDCKRRRDKADEYTWVETNDSLGGEEEFRDCIETTVFTHGAKNQNDKNDITILLHAKRSLATLVTGDRHILQNAGRLSSDCGIRVASAKQAVSEIRKCLRHRDAVAKNIARISGCKLPKWVGKD